MNIHALLARLRLLFRRDAESRMDAEFRFHMDMEVEKHIREGMSPEEARRRAAIDFGGAESHREEMRDGRSLAWIESWARELRLAGRTLLRYPGFSVVAVATLALGIGVNAGMFGLIDALLFRPPAHVVEPERAVRVQFTSEGAKRDGNPYGVWYATSYPAYEDLVRTGIFESVAGYTTETVSLGRGAEAQEADAMIVTPGFFRTLGVVPVRGALFGMAADDTIGGNRVVLSEAFWERQFGADPAVIGSSVPIGTSLYTIAGIAPRGFTALQAYAADLWLPMEGTVGGYLDSDWRTDRGDVWLRMVARLPPSAPARSVEERAAAVLHAATARPERAPTGIAISPLVGSRGDKQSREAQVALWLAAVASVVLLIACANIANLMIARNIARSREYAVRLSIGASHWQLRRHLLTDIIAIALPGAGAALYVDYLIRKAMRAFLEADVPLPVDMFDARMLGFTGIAGLITILFVAFVSLSQVRPGSLTVSLMPKAVDNRRGSGLVRTTLLALQAALCVALLFSAGLFATSLSRVLALDLGVDMERTVQVTINAPRGQRTRDEMREVYEEALTRIRALPGVERAALSGSHPFQSGSAVAPFTAERTSDELWVGAGGFPWKTSVGAGFFETVGAPSFEGRDFNESDRAGTPPVTIINANMARKLFPNGRALNQCIFLDDSPDCHRVVGILAGTWKLRALMRDQMVVYLPLAQTRNEAVGSLVIRTRDDPRSFLAQIRTTVQSSANDLPAVSIARASDLVAYEFRPWRLGASLFGGFALVALLIAAVGLYGVVGFTVTMRTREIGVRMALGARATHIMRTVAGSGLTAVVAGLLVGSAGALLASRWMGDVLYQTSPRDPIVLGQTSLVLLAVAVLAVAIPVARALRLPPSEVLRSE